MPTTLVAHLHTRGPVPYVPDRIRKGAKALDHGALQEHRMIELVNATHGEGTCWRCPGITSLRRNTGERYVPDAAGFLPELTATVGVYSADAPRRFDWNFLVSVKSQNCPGSAKQKLLTEIRDLAGVCDTRGVVAALIVQGSHFDAGTLEVARKTGEDHMIVLLTEDEVAAGALVPALVHMANRRRCFRRKLGPRGGLAPQARHTKRDWAYVERTRDRRAARRANMLALL